jgi:hypothetical protein
MMYRASEHSGKTSEQIGKMSEVQEDVGGVGKVAEMQESGQRCGKMTEGVERCVEKRIGGWKAGKNIRQ